MKRLLPIFGLVALVSGCTTTPASPPTAEERLMQDGKLLYELGRPDEARKQLQLLLAGIILGSMVLDFGFFLFRYLCITLVFWIVIGVLAFHRAHPRCNSCL
jgi:hypothetical protein